MMERAMPSPAGNDGTVPLIPVLGYHHVHDGDDDFFRTWPDLFRRQMEILLEDGYVPITPERLGGLSETTPRERYAMVTFDDGYVDFLDHAWPILRALRIPATLFVISGYIGGWNEWDLIRWAPHPHLDAGQLRQLHAEGVTIGSHSHTHRPLVQLDDAGIDDELRRSQSLLEALIAAPVRTLAYPGGAVSARVRAAARTVYDLGFATEADRGAACDRFLIPRFDPCFYGDLAMFRRELAERSAVPPPDRH